MSGITSKSLIALASLTGVGSATGVPIALHINGQTDAHSQASQGIGNKSANSLNKRVNFETLGKEVDQRGIEKGNIQTSPLPGKTELNQIIMGGNSDKGAVKEIFGTTCPTTQNNSDDQEDDCGFLGLDDGGLEFKIKAVQPQKQEGWNVYVVRNYQGRADFYDGSETQGKSFDQNTTYNELTLPDEHSKGKQVSAPAFTTIKNKDN